MLGYFVSLLRAWMSFRRVQDVRAQSVLRSGYRVIDRLFRMHRNGEISGEDYVNKLDKLKELMSKKIDEVEACVQAAATRRMPCDVLPVFIMEHFEHNGYFVSASAFARRFEIEEYSEGCFYRRMYRMKAMIEAGEYDEALDFCKENRSELRRLGDCESLHIENDLKKQKFLLMCRKNEICKALEFASKEFIKIHGDIKQYLPALVLGADFGNGGVGNEEWKVAERFCRCMLRLVKRGEKSRLMRRIEYGMMAYKTHKCFDEEEGARDERCPSCCAALRMREDVLFSKHEISILLCKGSKEVMDDLNQPYVFENGCVYGSRYIGHSELIYVGHRDCSDENTKYPRLCYIM
ncbi:hypothetical protein HK407_02g03210 [Ordospora pajunii]|uniref:uncharacterized protein n=1 Tax=Ordospora pajunii TaxID=3039483 RepID=UPI00295285CF|nr:uncharacterized protein HK407_02g03210 [Ordospora pajunii]KAH9412097.1 hypothetical protein HK407_02g03210 [Ordospora pajunii]